VAAFKTRFAVHIVKRGYMDLCGTRPQRMFSTPGPRNFHELRWLEWAQGLQNGLPASQSASSREIPTSLSIRSSSKLKSHLSCRRLSQVSTAPNQRRATCKSAFASELPRSGSKTNDCDIAYAPLMAGLRRSQGANLIEPAMPCQQSINSLPCPRFSHEGRRCPANCHP
jgi:hypothetical protein